MDLSKKQYFKIGEMAELFGLNIRTLRYYDQIGLVKPEHIDPDSGYRYYSTAQFEPLNTIRYLRELDVPLEEIREFLKGRDVEAMKRMMEGQLVKVEQRQRELDLVRRKLRARLSQIEEAQVGLAPAGERKASEVEIRRLAGRHAFLLRYAVEADSDLEYPIRLLAKDVGTQGVFLGMIGLSIDAQKLAAEEFDHYDYIFLLQEAGEEAGTGASAGGPAFAFPAGDYAILKFRGTHKDAAAHYPVLMEGIRRLGYEICGNSLEITLIDYGLTSDPESFVTELQIPVR